jgi:cobalt transporter subunit CbtA
MWKRIALAAALAGLAAGLTLTAVQQMQVAPLIEAAEVLEASLPGHANAQEPESPAPASRLAATAVANVVLATGFALILAACLALRGHRGWRIGLAWGLAGYAVFFVAPALGLPPELPGMESAPLQDRTIWWLETALLTAWGLWLIAFGARKASRIAGLALIVVPHVLGAPPAVRPTGAMRDMALQFAFATALANALLWLVIGAVAGGMIRSEKRVPATPI